jgi:hypothetical protein
MTKQRDDIQQLDDGRFVVAFYSERREAWFSHDCRTGGTVSADELDLLPVPRYASFDDALGAAIVSHGDTRQLQAAIDAEKRPTLVI